MAILLWTILCQELQDHHDTISLLHVFTTTSVKSIPAKIDKFSVVSAFDGNLGEKFDYRVNFQTPDGKPHGPAMNLQHFSIRRIPEIVCTDFGDYHFFEYGIYTIEIEVNRNPIHIVELKITQ